MTFNCIFLQSLLQNHQNYSYVRWYLQLWWFQKTKTHEPSTTSFGLSTNHTKCSCHGYYTESNVWSNLGRGNFVLQNIRELMTTSSYWLQVYVIYLIITYFYPIDCSVVTRLAYSLFRKLSSWWVLTLIVLSCIIFSLF